MRVKRISKFPIQDVPVPSLTKPTFTTRHTHANEGIFTQLTSELVAMHIGPDTHESATMLVNVGASHILVRQEHAQVLTNVTMSPNGHAFPSLKSAKKGSELSAIGKGVLQIGPFFLPALIFNIQQRRVRGHTPRTGPFNRGLMHSSFQQGIISTVPGIIFNY